ncbi:MAG: DUF4347 domain-containing protein [Okeania sp. SIO3B5]|uniref:DUF4347 domain-containing protein n=1 Tax=Okeania sp. SIO3B5 TaxID=2607811 RepID=UPI0013FFADC8|nr:DUF4347 domain-containing protein [Okeania sp. SIO3B5]NEO57816.1 DUF4347 domain-containing protein [Okeania sp. SIO3B5]
MNSNNKTFNQTSTLVFIDAGVDNYQQLFDGVVAEAQPFVIDTATDGIQQISQILQQYPEQKTVHIISHGSPGCLYLGNSQLSLDSIKPYQLQLQQWQLDNLLLYGCNVAAGDAGEEFIEKLQQLTGAEIAASTNKVGSSALGGNWHLNFSMGSIASFFALTPEAMQSYSGVFNQAPSVGTVNILPGNSLNNGLGGVQGFGENELPAQDDGFVQVDVSAVFENGFRYFDNTWNAATEFFISYNGYVTFGQGLGAYDPAGIAGSTLPMIAAHYTDVDTGNPAIAFDPAGNSTGSNRIYYDIDPVNDVVTITFDDVVPYSNPPGLTNANAYQIRLWDLGDGDFGIEIRYEDLAWGQSGTSNYGTAGWTAGDQTNYDELPGSGTSDIENIESQSNINQPGVFFWEVQDGGVPSEPVGLAAIDINETDPPGVSVSDPAFTQFLADSDGDALGIAVVEVDNTNGSWQYSTDGGNSWNDFGSPSDANARLLAGTANNQIRFVPNPDYEGNAGNIFFRAWDQTTGTNGGTADTSTNGGTTAFSSGRLSTTLNVVPINDQPTFTAADPPVVNGSSAQTINGWATFNPGPTDEASQTATYNVSNISNPSLFAVAPTIDSSGNLTYTPAPSASGTSTFDVVVQDSGGTLDGGVDTSDSQTFSIAVNSLPTINSNNSASIPENTTAAITVTATDSDGDPINYRISGGEDQALFDIDSLSGAVSFNNAPDFENPGDNNGDNNYLIEVTANDGTVDSSPQAITISVTDVNENVAPSINSNNSASVLENTTAAITVTATDDDGDPITYSITGGEDQALFGIDSVTGAVSFNSAPDFEIPGDSDGDNNYLIEVTANDGTVDSTPQAITISVSDVNEVPTINSSNSATVAENTIEAITVAATDEDGDTIEYSISGGEDQALFGIDSLSGAVSFNSTPDFEIPGDSDGDNNYLIEVTANDGTVDSTPQAITIGVTDANDPPAIAPSNFASLLENTTAAITVTATDPDSDLLNYRISGGEDQALFGIDSVTGAVSFNSAPDFEIPGDSDSDNNYLIEVTANDGTVDSTPQAITISVTDVVEGTPGKDILRGANTAEHYLALGDNDRVYGYGGADNIDGGDGNDIIYGGNDNDTLDGGLHHDRLYGDNGNDLLLGNDGNDILYGRAGDDTLNGGLGNDRYNGGAGADTFIIGPGLGVDMIQRFEDGTDIIELQGIGFDDLDIVKSGSSTSIKVAATGETLATLSGINVSLVGADDFSIG